MQNNNIRVPGEMCEESLYDNYEKANQGLVDKLHGSRDTLQDIIAASDEAGRVFRFEAGHPFRFESGHHCELKVAGVASPGGLLG
jgi:hypothetical protein